MTYCQSIDCSSLADARTYVPTGLLDDWCEAGTRRGHYDWRWFGARPAQGTATTTGDGLVRGRHKARPLQLAMVWCEAGTRRGHYNWRWFGSRPAQGTTTTTAGGHNGFPLTWMHHGAFTFQGPAHWRGLCNNTSNGRGVGVEKRWNVCF